MRAPRRQIVWVLAAMLLGVGCEKPEDSETPSLLAVTNPYLQAAVCDLLGPQAPVEVLSSPGNCPGRFDISARQAAALRKCRLLLRFDFQSHLEEKLGPSKDAGLRVVPIAVPGGLAEPESYLAVCRQTAEALRGTAQVNEEALSERLEAVERRVTDTAASARSAIDRAGLFGHPVLAAEHQAAFCRDLGLDVVATYDPDGNSFQLSRAYSLADSRGVKLVVGNVPQGRKAADRLADELGGRVAMLDNFPAPQPAEARDRFDRMVMRNVARLLEAAGR